MTYGEKPEGGGWRVAVMDPFDTSAYVGILTLDGGWCVSTSGDYQRFVEAEGVRYHHIYDPSSGYPAQSGVAGVTELSSDMRDVEDAIAEGNERAKLALDMYEYRILKYIGAYTAVLGGVDVIVFTGGVGENQTITRERVCKQLAYLGIDFDVEANNCRGKEVLLTRPDSKVKVVVIPTDEELMIARDTAAIASGK